MKRSRWRQLAQDEARMVGERVTVAGVDEAGRGPLAGPVVAAAVVLDPTYEWEGLDDSKQMSAAAREDAYARVLKGARAFAWAVVGPRTIDRINIRMATHGAMAKAVRRLRVTPDLVLIDGHEKVAELGIEQLAVIKGDATCLSIAAASVLAKVVRDRIMTRLDGVWPQYGFAGHKGYGSADHIAAIHAHGPCPAHRFSFAPVRELELKLY